jgi:hypothetical protein
MNPALETNAAATPKRASARRIARCLAALYCASGAWSNLIHPNPPLFVTCLGLALVFCPGDLRARGAAAAGRCSRRLLGMCLPMRAHGLATTPVNQATALVPSSAITIDPALRARLMHPGAAR